MEEFRRNVERDVQKLCEEAASPSNMAMPVSSGAQSMIVLGDNNMIVLNLIVTEEMIATALKKAIETLSAAKPDVD